MTRMTGLLVVCCGLVLTACAGKEKTGEMDVAVADAPGDAGDQSSVDECVSWCERTGSECGDDNCGGSCGECPESYECVETDVGYRFCYSFELECPLDCEEAKKQCGWLTIAIAEPLIECDCGSCAEDEVCVGDEPETASYCCAPDCDGKECGDDGCGGSCGECGEWWSCLSEAVDGPPICMDGEELACEFVECGSSWWGECVGEDGPCWDVWPWCPCPEGLLCVDDDGKVLTPYGGEGDGEGSCALASDVCGNGVCDVEEAGESCASCPADCFCPTGSCVDRCGDYNWEETCQCDDGCAFEGDCCSDFCEWCGGIYPNLCCEPECEGKECGDDECGGSCGECEEPMVECVEGQCELVCDCLDDEDCLPVEDFDLCNGKLVCGLTTPCKCELDPDSVVECPDGQTCIPETGECCQPSCEGKSCDEDDGCGGKCGECPVECSNHGQCGEGQLCLGEPEGWPPMEVCGICGDIEDCHCAIPSWPDQYGCATDAECEQNFMCGDQCDDCPVTCPKCVHGWCAYDTFDDVMCLCEGCA